MIMDKKIKILLVPPLYGGSLPITYYCADALKQLGHQVEIFDSPPFLQAYKALSSIKISQARLTSLEQSFIQLLSQAVYAMAEEWQPDLVLAMAQAPLNRMILRKFQNDKVKTAMWFVEDYGVFPYWQSLAPCYDYFFIIQKEPFLSKLQEIGVQNALYLPMAADPNFHSQVQLSAEEKKFYGSDLSFMGAGYPNRRVAFRSLLKYDFKIWGSDWQNDNLLQKYLQKNGERISSEESVKIYNASKINLNLHSGLNPKKLVSGGDFVNPRTFELASMNAFQLVDKRTLLEEHFICADLDNQVENAELAVFEDMESLHANIVYYLKNPELREKIAHNARKRIEKDHSYQNRMQTLLDHIANTSTDWPELKEQEIAWPENFSQEAKEQIQSLCQEFGIAPDCSFQTIVSHVKSKSGELSEKEVALLFLDEWKKFYS